MSKLKDGDRVVTTRKLFVVGYSKDWLEAGAEGIVLGRSKADKNYLTVKLDAVHSPTYVRESNLELIGTPLEDLSFNDSEMTVEFWEGDKLNAPWVRFYTETYEYKYDQDYDTESRIVGDSILRRDDMIRLRDFLDKAIDKSEGWVYRGHNKKGES